jgi:DNA-binding transcriptional MocR family regulator
MAHARYKKFVDAFAADIRSGKLAPGTRLPTHRRLAATEKFALVTASRIYAELEAMGLVAGETGRGTFVREAPLSSGAGMDQHLYAADVVDLNFNYPSLPGQADLLRSALKHVAQAGEIEALLRYQPHAGRAHEREIVARHLRLRGLVATPDQVMIVSGAQHGLAIAVMALFKPGDVVATDAVTYSGFKVLAQLHGLELAALPFDREGIDPESLERLCARRRVRAIYVQPTLHNPLGYVMNLRRREELVAIARRHALSIIEDAAYAFLAQDPPPPLARLFPENTVYVCSLSKSVATGLRVGFVVAPQKWVAGFERAIQATTWNTPGVMTAIACEWMEDGTVARLEKEKRRDARKRQQVVSDVFDGMRHLSHPSSYFTWIALAGEVRADRVARALHDRRISVSTAEPFSSGAHAPNAIRLALGSVDLEPLRRALTTVRDVIVEQTDL